MEAINPGVYGWYRSTVVTRQAGMYRYSHSLGVRSIILSIICRLVLGIMLKSIIGNSKSFTGSGLICTIVLNNIVENLESNSTHSILLPKLLATLVKKGYV